ncbi:MAG: PH domain-containing protein [bacterium]|nr:PH domain-containing protein [bacterium]
MPFRKIKFISELREDEQIYLVFRKHWVIPAIKVLIWFFILGLLAFMETLAKAEFPLLTEGLPALILDTIQTIFLITSCLGLFIVWVMYYLNVHIVTNERIVDINQISVLHHQTAELNLDRFQDVTTKIKGPLANFFNYGSVHVQTAGEMQNFVFEDVPDPHRVAKLVLELYEKVREKQANQITQD